MEKIKTKNFNELVIEAKGLVVIDFFADWCGPCRMLAPVLEKVAALETNVAFYKVNVDENNDLAHQYKVTSIPTLIAFKDGIALESSLGFMPEDELLEWVQKNK